jgi:hypothetical protein
MAVCTVWNSPRNKEWVEFTKFPARESGSCCSNGWRVVWRYLDAVWCRRQDSAVCRCADHHNGGISNVACSKSSCQTQRQDLWNRTRPSQSTTSSTARLTSGIYGYITIYLSGKPYIHVYVSYLGISFRVRVRFLLVAEKENYFVSMWCFLNSWKVIYIRVWCFEDCHWMFFGGCVRVIRIFIR